MPGAGVDKAVRKVMEAVAKHMIFNVPTKSAVIKGQKVEYFSGDTFRLITMTTDTS